MGIKVGIGIITTGTVKTDTLFALLGMLKNTDVDYTIITQTGCYIQQNRTIVVKEAIKAKCTHLLFVDHDMRFEPDALQRLLERDKDIVGVNYNLRRLPVATVVKKEDLDGNVIWEKNENGLVQCCGLGTGFLLIKLSVFDKLKHPWFLVEHDDKGGLKCGEDMYFCYEAMKAGFKIWLDPTLVVGHIGDFTY